MKTLRIERIEWAGGPLASGTKVYLSDGSELEGVVHVSHHAEAGDIQRFTVTVTKDAKTFPPNTRRAASRPPPTSEDVVRG